MKKTLFIVVVLLQILSFNVFAEEAVQFFTPILFKHIFLLAEKDKRLDGTLENPLFAENRPYSLPGRIVISELPLDADLQKQYDRLLSLSISLVKGSTYYLYIKNDCIMKLVEKGSDASKVYVREFDTNKLDSLPKDYAALTLKTLMDIYSKEDLIPALMIKGKIDHLDFQISGFAASDCGGSSIAVMTFPEFSMKKIVQFRENILTGVGLSSLAEDKQILLSFDTDKVGYVEKASMCDESFSGFECHFFPGSHLLKDYVPLKSKEWGKLTIWNKNGIQVAVRDYYPGCDNSIPRKYHPGTWGLGLSLFDFRGCEINNASYWDESTSSPSYSGILKTGKEGETSEFTTYFSDNNKLLEQKYESLQKELKLECASVSPVKFKESNIGEKSLGIMDKEQKVKKLIFLRKPGILVLDSHEGRDIRELASELDKCWGEQFAEQK